MSKDRGGRAYRWVLFNYTDEMIEKIKSLKTTYLVWGWETCPTTGKPHLQGYMYLKDCMTLSAVRKKQGWDIRPCDGTAASNRDYCLKIRPEDKVPNERFYERGDCPVGQGKRTDIDGIKKVIDETKGGPRTKLLACFNANFGCAVKNYRGFQVYIDLIQEKRDEKPEVFWIWGNADQGKSRCVYDAFGKANVFSKPDGWYDGYDNEKCFLIDDYDENTISTKELLKLLDRYAFAGRVKGSFVQIVSPVIVITCDYPPSHFWHEGNKLDQVLRRFRTVHEKKIGDGFVLDLE